jgi:hypothetical protein
MLHEANYVYMNAALKPGSRSQHSRSDCCTMRLLLSSFLFNYTRE